MAAKSPANPAFPRTTRGGYLTWEVISALQKAIRRSQPELAMFWVLELESVGLLAWALARLRVIAHEDIGVGDMAAVNFALSAVDQAAEWHKAKKATWHMAAGNAVLALANARKSRIGDEFQAAVRGRIAKGWKPEMPDEALDKHTVRGKRMGRGIEHFLTDAAKLVTPTLTEMLERELTYRAEATEFWRAREAVERNEPNEAEQHEPAQTGIFD